MKLVEDNVKAGPKWRRDSMISRMAGKFTLSNLTSECMGTMFGGVINLANMLPFGAFCVCSDMELQERLYEELKSVWEDPNEPIPPYSTLFELPVLVCGTKLVHSFANNVTERCRKGESTVDARYHHWPATGCS